MHTKDFWFELPPEQIAQYPLPHRGDSRLLVLEATDDAARDTPLHVPQSDPHLTPAINRHNALVDTSVTQLPQLLAPDSLMVFNDTRVRPLRLVATRQPGGGRQELLLIEPLEGGLWRCMMSHLRRQRVGQRFEFPDGLTAWFEQRTGSLALLRFARPVDNAYLQRWGSIPLPPYIRRAPTALDRERYQTLFARHDGSAAAPTAGLHFSAALLKHLRARGIAIEFITLHVGPGTFEPVRGDDPRLHRMHAEQFRIEPEVADRIEAAHHSGRPIVAVGTTVVRALETAWQPESRSLRRGTQHSDLFIYPPFSFRVVDRMFTNFHTPGSTLLMLVCAFAGTQRVLAAYRHAVAQGYRFFSFGDAMLLGRV